MFGALRKPLLSIAVFVLLTGSFFIRLWIPEPQIFMIPEYGLSDVLHTHFPGRQYVGMMLKEHQWPIWTPFIGTGFPILAEGLVGAFFLPNLLLFRFLPAADAYNLSLAVSFLLAAFGTYWFSRQHRLTSLAAIVSALTFAFGGYFSVQLNHPNYVQAASLLPLLLAATVRLHRQPSIPSLLIVSLLFSQQLLTGGFQFAWITGFASVAYLILWPQHQLLPVIRRLCLFAGGIVLAAGLAAIQLLPTLELLRTADRFGGLPFETATAFPYPPHHLRTFVFPYFFGSPAHGTYPTFSADWGLFWENTAYIGVIPLVLALSSLVWIRRTDIRRWWGILGVSLLLVLGKYSPLYFLYSFPVFSSFRVPSRFLIAVMFCLVCLYGLTIDRILHWLSRRTRVRSGFGMLILVMVVALGFLDEFRFSYEYPPATPVRWWIQPDGEAAEILDTVRRQPGRMFTIGAEIPWNDRYLTDGWKHIVDYRQHVAFLRPNANMLFSIPSAGIYAGPGIAPKRLQLVQNLMMLPDTSDAATQSAEPSSLPMSRLSEAILRENYVTTVLSSFPVTFTSATAHQKFSLSTGTGTLSVYVTQLSPLSRTRLAFATKTISTVEDAVRHYAEEKNETTSIVLIEDEQYALAGSSDPQAAAVITAESPNMISIHTNSTKPAILILADSYYPGWQTTDNATPTEIFPVNLNQRGIRLEEGSHEVVFMCKPQSFEIGKRITYISGSVVIFLLFISRIRRSLKHSSVLSTPGKVSSDRSGSPDPVRTVWRKIPERYYK